jgi:DNA-binding transcriptional ArsR family regulator
MKSQDVVVLLKLISLHNEFFLENSVEGDLLMIKGEFEDWSENELDHPEINNLNLIGEYVEKRFSVRSLEADTGISKSQISLSLKRMNEVGLAKIDRKLGIPKANSKALLEFIAYGIRYVFPAKQGELSRGITTSIAAPVLQGKLMTAGEFATVWPYAKGKTKGFAIEPLHPNIYKAVRYDGRMYAYLALTDAIRLGNPRERNFAMDTLQKLFKISI